MKILQICNKIPYPFNEGSSIAINLITDGLIKRNNKVKLLAINTPKHFIELANIPEDYRKKTNIESVFVDTDVKFIYAFLNLFSNKSYNIIRFYDETFEKKLIEVLKSEIYDVVQIESIFIAPYLETIRKYSNAKVVMREHNIEFLIWQRLSQSCKNPLKKFYLDILFKRLKKYEMTMLDRYDGIAAISGIDVETIKKLGCRIPVTNIPIGINIENYDIQNKGEEFPSLFHIGSMNWMPNQEAVKWFVNNVWQSVLKRYPQLKFYLAGKKAPMWLKNINVPNVTFVGEVESAKDFMLSKSIMVVPLLSGSGMRVKIIEGMALGKTIISTTIGAEGIDCTNGENILIADTPEEFLLAIGKCIEDKDYCKKIGNNARQLIVEKYNNDMIIEKLVGFYQELNKKHLQEPDNNSAF
ncbi:MAG: glycosyltransferase family 4 protein [Bacteroidales bacterium]|jgi:glycosyltransferase involved in cell wall biosynthesis